MSNWEPEEVSDADMEDIAGGAGKGKPKPKPDPAKDPDAGGGDTKPKPYPGKSRIEQDGFLSSAVWTSMLVD